MIPQSHRITANPTNPQFFQNPYKTYAKYRNRRLFYWNHYQIWCATSFSLVDALLRDRRFARVMPPESAVNTGVKGVKSPPESIPDDASHLADFHAAEAYSLLNLEPPVHTRLRGRLNHAFVARQIKDLERDITALARAHLRQLKPAGEADLLPHYATPIPATIIARMIGVPDECINQLLHWSHAMVKVYTLTQSHSDEVAANTAAAEFSDFLRDLIREKHKRPQNDLLSHLIHSSGAATGSAAARRSGSASPATETPEHKHTMPGSDADALTEQEIIGLTILLLNAGHEATVHQTGNALKTLLESNQNIEALFSSARQTTATIAELMRYDAPLHLFLRYATCDVTIDDVTLKAGEQIGLCLGAANRDPERFNNADHFDPFRTDGGSVSLGAGVHFCVGAQLARLELETILPLVFQELPGLALAAEPRYRNSFHFHGLEQLQVRWRL